MNTTGNELYTYLGVVVTEGFCCAAASAEVDGGSIAEGQGVLLQHSTCVDGPLSSSAAPDNSWHENTL